MSNSILSVIISIILSPLRSLITFLMQIQVKRFILLRREKTLNLEYF